MCRKWKISLDLGDSHQCWVEWTSINYFNYLKIFWYCDVISQYQKFSISIRSIYLGYLTFAFKAKIYFRSDISTPGQPNSLVSHMMLFTKNIRKHTWCSSPKISGSTHDALHQKYPEAHVTSSLELVTMNSHIPPISVTTLS
jgi:hypothetical protein